MKSTTSQVYMTSPPSTHLTSRPIRHSASAKLGDPIKIRYSHAASRSSQNGASLSEGYAKIPTLLSSQTGMRHELTFLNDRFAQYIDKVKRLEAQKKVLEKRISELQSSKGSSSGSASIYESALAKLRSEIAILAHEKASLQVQLDNCEQDLIDARARLEDEIHARKGFEKEAEAGRTYVDDATIKLCDKDRQLETLQEKHDLLKAATDENIAALTSQQVVVKHESALESAPAQSGELSESLKEIRDAYEQLSTTTDSQVVTMYKKKINDLQAQLKKANQVASAAKADLASCDKTLQTYMTEIEGLRSTNASLGMHNANLQACMERERAEANNKIQELEDKLHSVNEEMADCLAQYNKFVNMKKSFDIEIAAYRKLLEGEEDRLDGAADAIHSGSGTVSQSVTVHKTTHSYYSELRDAYSDMQHGDDVTTRDIDEGDINFLEQLRQGPSTEDGKAEDHENSLAPADTDSSSSTSEGSEAGDSE